MVSLTTAQPPVGKIGLEDYLASLLQSLLILRCESCQHFCLQGSRKSQEGEEAEHKQTELPAEDEGDEDGRCDVSEGVDHHPDLRASSLQIKGNQAVTDIVPFP